MSVERGLRVAGNIRITQPVRFTVATLKLWDLMASHRNITAIAIRRQWKQPCRGNRSDRIPCKDVLYYRKSSSDVRKFSSAMIDDESAKRKSNLQALLQESDLNQRQVSVATGFTERIIYDWIVGRSLPRLDRAVVLAKVLGVSLKRLAKEFGLDVEGVPNDADGQNHTLSNAERRRAVLSLLEAIGLSRDDLMAALEDESAQPQQLDASDS